MVLFFLYLFWVVCNTLVLEKEGSPVNGFHLTDLLLDVFGLLPALTVLLIARDERNGKIVVKIMIL